MINRPIEDITQADIISLQENGEEESQTLDFKQALPGMEAGAKHEFYADICAFANAQGGDIVYGVAEDDEGRAAHVIPLNDNADDVVLRLQDMALNGIEPKVTGIHVRAVSVNGGSIFVVRIPRSLHSPHRVKTNQHFFIREGRRKRPLDVPEVRIAFLRSAEAGERIRNFRAERAGRILAGDGPVRLANGVIAMLHLIPLQPSSENSVDPRTYQLERHLPVMSGGPGLDFRLNLDGGVAHRPITDNGCGAYTLIFRDGKIEATRVFTSLLQNGLINVPSSAYEQEILQFMTSMTQEMQRLELGPPFVVMFSLLRAKNGCLGVGGGIWFAGDTYPTFDRDVLAYPEIVIDRIDQLDISLRPMFDLVWQSAGQPHSLNYNAEGRWERRN